MGFGGFEGRNKERKEASYTMDTRDLFWFETLEKSGRIRMGFPTLHSKLILFIFM